MRVSVRIAQVKPRAVREPQSVVVRVPSEKPLRRCQVSDPARWSRVTDIVGTGAVVVSLLYVGLQVRQNTAAIQTSTSQEVYQQNQEQGLLVMESAEFAEILLEASRDLATLSPIDSIRYHHYLNVSLNTYEAVYTNALQGTMESDMAAGWLDGLGGLRCKAGMAAYWDRQREAYHRAFRTAVDSAWAVAKCPE